MKSRAEYRAAGILVAEEHTGFLVWKLVEGDVGVHASLPHLLVAYRA